MDWLRSQPVLMQAFLAGLFIWGCTIVGSAVVFFFKKVSRKLLDIMMGFAAGVMIAASFWSLLAPSIEYAQSSYGKLSWLPAAIGFLVGGFFLRLIDAVVPHLHLSKDISEAESVPEHSRKKLSKTALSIPIRTDGKSSRLKAFYWGSMSAIVEPIGAVLGAVAVMVMTAILPYALSFAAGAMIFVVVEELIPDSQTNGNTDVATLGLMVGFVLMMVLDVALG